MSNRFTDKAEKVLNNAQASAEAYGHTYIGSEHLLIALSIDSLSCSFAILSKCGITKEKIDSGIKEYSGFGAKSKLTSKDMTPRCRKIIENSYKNMLKYSSQKIGTEHILLSIIEQKDSVAVKILEYCNCDLIALKDELITFLRTTDRNYLSKKQNDGVFHLSQYGKNLTRLAKEGKLDPVIGRDKETERLIRILSRRSKNNPCLIGEAGVGKTAIVEGLAKRIADGTVPETLKEKIIYSIDLTSMIAGAKYRGDFEERIKSTISEAAKNPFVILFIDEIHTIVGAGSAEGAIDAANILKPELARSSIQLIGATTLAEYRKHIEKDPALERRFQPLLVEEASTDATIKILTELKPSYEKHHSVIIDDNAIISAVKLSERYIQDRFLPDKALDLLDEACAKVSLSNVINSAVSSDIEEKLRQFNLKKEEAVKSKNFILAEDLHRHESNYINELKVAEKSTTFAAKHVTEDDVKRIVTEMTGIALSDLNKDASPEWLKERLSADVIGQEKAIDLLSAAVLRSQAGLSDPRRPRGVFLFIGESGVGKTALGYALSKHLFAGKESLIKLDMSEFGEKHSVSKIIGSPPGYVGYEDGGALCEKIRRHPYSVVMFDEIEKASPEVQNLLLQIMDEGNLTDSTGRRVSFKDSYIIMTSNIAADGLNKNLHTGFIDTADNSEKSLVIQKLKNHLKSEFINRIDEIIPFTKLSIDSLGKIADIFLTKLKKRLNAIGVEFNYSSDVPMYIAGKGLTAGFGARPISRLITQEIENKLSLLLIGKKSDNLHINIDIINGEIRIITKERTPATE
ncbi:MAG: ATP-dependent Clp protease ATP-binding subunit [Clostridia bacterium]|nr:ATP-dependent Clp protease ATP-binding subunit [Clostridia bacterium]